MTLAKLQLLESAFSPSAPINSRDLFLGRYEQVEKVVEAMNERGQHFVVFGDRGVGKTSLANIIYSYIENVIVVKVTCNRGEDFKQVWEKAFSKVRFSREKPGIGFTPEKVIHPMQMDLFLPNKADIDSLDIQSVFEAVQGHLCFVFDEFDSINSSEVKIKFADTIKALSDNAPHVTIGIVGIASSVDDLIGSHLSLERCLKQIKMPRMSKEELRKIIFKGLSILNLEIDDLISEKIVSFSSGFPHFTHLLTKYSAKECIQQDLNRITHDHYRKALDSAIDNTNQSIRDSYQKATMTSTKDSKFENVVAACALADVDDFGTFAIRDIVEPYYKVTGAVIKTQNINYNIQKLCEMDRGSILVRVGGANNIRYQFKNPLMKVYIKMKLDQDGTFQQPGLFESLG